MFTSKTLVLIQGRGKLLDFRSHHTLEIVGRFLLVCVCMCVCVFKTYLQTFESILCLFTDNIPTIYIKSVRLEEIGRKKRTYINYLVLFTSYSLHQCLVTTYLLIVVIL